MRFKSRDGEEKRIAMTDGQMAIVGKEWKELPDSMENEAYAAGCVSEGDIKKGNDAADAETLTTKDADAKYLTNKDKVKNAIKEMIESDDPSMITKAGLPDRRILNTKVGFTVTTEIFDAAWAEIQAEAKEP